MGRPYYDSGLRQPALLVVRRWRYFTLFQGAALLEEVITLNTLVPNVRLIPYLGKGKDPPFDEAFDTYLNLQIPVCLMPAKSRFSSPFQTKPGINLKTQALKNGCAPRFPFAQYSRKFRLSKVDAVLAAVHADWEGLKEMLSPVEAVGRYNKLLT